MLFRHVMAVKWVDHSIKSEKQFWLVYVFGHINIPNSLLMKSNCSSLRGFVKILASWCLVSMNSMTTSWLVTWSRIKWCLISICFVLECCIGFFVKHIALVFVESQILMIKSIDGLIDLIHIIELSVQE